MCIDAMCGINHIRAGSCLLLIPRPEVEKGRQVPAFLCVIFTTESGICR